MRSFIKRTWVNVHNMLIRKIKPFWERHWQWIIGTLMMPLLLLTLNRYLEKESGKTEEGVSNGSKQTAPSTRIPEEKSLQELEVHITVAPQAFTKYLGIDKIKMIADSLGKGRNYAIEFKYPTSIVPHRKLKDIYYYPASKMEIAINNEILPISLLIEEVQYDDSKTIQNILEQRIDKLLTDNKERIQEYITNYIRDK